MSDPLAGRLAFLHTPLTDDRGEGVPLSGSRQNRLDGSPCGRLLPDPRQDVGKSLPLSVLESPPYLSASLNRSLGRQSHLGKSPGDMGGAHLC